MVKVRADLIEALVGNISEQCDELAEDANVQSTLPKAQLAILVPDFDASRIGFFKDIVDGKVADPSDLV
ncbi:hypothetical protein PIB30_075998 [Stylosanthes scabra]|uniref:Uncharacterized protein n=1 Tax=Stylosanthes scabra TaxID=79078 RepID=A0ABU6VTK5_9FABA|nr:hypothetical protein [Stylosanthes scabra]